jgi:rhamnose transport system permease protein
VPVVLTGEIDLSLGSILAVGTILLAKLALLQVPLWAAVLALAAVGCLLGWFNGLLVARLGLPSLAVTLGTMVAYRGIAFIVGTEEGYTEFGPGYLWLGETALWSVLPVALLVFAAVVALFALAVHTTVFGRKLFAIGGSPDASRFTGLRVTRVKMQTYVLSGLVSALAALIWIGQYGSARADNADSVILLVITAVVLGGVDINGAHGTVVGVTLSVLLLGTLTNGMGLANVPGPIQTVVFGSLLVLSVLVSNFARWRTA